MFEEEKTNILPPFGFTGGNWVKDGMYPKIVT
jgi:hypothetical protein